MKYTIFPHKIYIHKIRINIHKIVGYKIPHTPACSLLNFDTYTPTTYSYTDSFNAHIQRHITTHTKWLSYSSFKASSFPSLIIYLDMLYMMPYMLVYSVIDNILTYDLFNERILSQINNILTYDLFNERILSQIIFLILIIRNYTQAGLYAQLESHTYYCYVLLLYMLLC